MSRAENIAAREPWSDRLCDAACMTMALWTVCSNAVVAMSGNLYVLLACFAVAFVAAALVICRVGFADRIPRSPASAEESPTNERLPRISRRVGLFLGLFNTLAFAWHRNFMLLWWCMAGILVTAAAISFFFERPKLEAPRQSHRSEMLLFALASCCAILALVVHRPDVDDAFYVGIAAATVDQPHRALLSFEPFFGIEGLPLHLSIYKIHSYELINAAVSSLTGIPAIYSFHWIATAIAAFFVPLALARFYRLLLPNHWLWAVITTILVFVAVGETHRWYGNFTLVRIWQGKSIFLSIFMPLVYAYSLRFALAPSWRSVAVLAASLIAAVGCTSSALWAAPAAMLVLITALTTPTISGLKRIAGALLVPCYVLALAIKFKETMSAQVRLKKASAFAVPEENLSHILTTAFGDSRFLIFALTAVAVSWALCPSALSRRFAVAVPLATWITFLNPYLTFWVSQITGPSFWRASWALATPILIALLLLAPLQWCRHTRLGPMVCLLGLVLFAELVPAYGGLSLENEVMLAPPQLKVDMEEYRVAEALKEIAGSGSRVATPTAVGAWVATQHHPPHLMTLRTYLHFHRRRIPGAELALRHDTMRYLDSGPDMERAHRFVAGIKRLDVDAVCLRHRKWSEAGDLRQVLAQGGFRRARSEGRYDIWVRAPRPDAGVTDSPELPERGGDRSGGG